MNYYDVLLAKQLGGDSGGGGGGEVSVSPLSVSANGVYSAPEGSAYSPVTVSVPSSGAWEVEMGTYIPTTLLNVTQPEIEFTNHHEKAPVIAMIFYADDEPAGKTWQALHFIFVDYERLNGKEFARLISGGGTEYTKAFAKSFYIKNDATTLTPANVYCNTRIDNNTNEKNIWTYVTNTKFKPKMYGGGEIFTGGREYKWCCIFNDTL